MDNMAYLQTIAKKSPNNQPKGGGFDLDILKKFLNIKTAIIAGIVLLFLIVLMAVASSLNKVSTEDRDYLIRSTFAATYLDELIIEEYTEDVKSSDLRAMGATLRGTLKSIIARNTNSLLSVYGTELSEYEESYGAEEQTRINDIKNTFDTARISGMLDRVYLRELTLQIMVIYNYESEVNSRSENETIKSDTASDMENLNTVYNQFSEYKDLSS